MKWWIFVAMSLCLPALAEPVPAVKVPTDAVPGAKTEAPAETPAAAADDEPEEPESVKRNLRTFSSAVNVLRQNDRVEAVFRNGEIVALPRGARQHKIFKVLKESEQTGAAVSVTVNDRTGVIHSVKGADDKRQK